MKAEQLHETPDGYGFVISFPYNGGDLSIFKGENLNEACAVYVIPHLSGAIIHEFYFKLVNLPEEFTVLDLQEKLMAQIDLEYIKIVKSEREFSSVQ